MLWFMVLYRNLIKNCKLIYNLLCYETMSRDMFYCHPFFKTFLVITINVQNRQKQMSQHSVESYICGVY